LLFLVLFLVALLLFLALMSWLVLFHHTIIHRVLNLYDITDMRYKLLLVAVAALNFFICYLIEVQTNTCHLEHETNISNCSKLFLFTDSY